MKTKCVVPGEIDCKYINQCKDYKKSWVLGQSSSKCTRCKKNKNAKVKKDIKKSYFELMY